MWIFFLKLFLFFMKRRVWAFVYTNLTHHKLRLFITVEKQSILTKTLCLFIQTPTVAQNLKIFIRWKSCMCVFNLFISDKLNWTIHIKRYLISFHMIWRKRCVDKNFIVKQKLIIDIWKRWRVNFYVLFRLRYKYDIY